jgi:transcriptional regulator GlxA family with amidase domain
VNDPLFLAAIKLLAKKSRRIGSICNGAFILAACGLLDNFRAVTHWESCDELTQTYPQISVQPNQIFVNDRNRWTSAGVTAGIDMAIAMISHDIGRAGGLAIARSLVTYHVRPGGQSQFSDVLRLQLVDAQGRFEELHQWILNNLRKELRVEQLADRVSMSPRNFARLYRSHTGRTPAKAVEALRVEAARRLLEDGKLPINSVASRCGFGDDERMRRSFVRVLSVSPQDYRNRFR